MFIIAKYIVIFEMVENITQTKHQAEMEKRIDALNDKRYDLQFDIVDKVSALVDVKWDAPTLQKEIQSLVRENQKNWHDIFEAEEAAGHDPVPCTSGKDC